MHRTPAILPASLLVACSARQERRHAHRPGPVWGTVKGLAVALLLASAAGAGAQTPRNGPEWSGKDHQPTEAETLQLERQSGVQAPKAEQNQDNRTVQQLDQQLLRKEGLDSNPAPPAQR